MLKKSFVGILLLALCGGVSQAANQKKQRALGMVEKAKEAYVEGNFAAMHKAIAKALDLDTQCSKAYVYLGIHYIRLDDLKQATEWLEKALLADPGDPLAFTYLGEVHYRNNDLPTAADYWRKAVHYDECNSEAQAGLALSLYRSGRESDAILHYKEAIRCDRRYYDVKYLSDATKGAGWPEAKVAAVLPLLELVPPPALR